MKGVFIIIKFKYNGIIYLITNKINNKQYIGKTTRPLNKRWSEHKYDSKNKSKKNKSYLHRAMNKYGLENFSIEIIDIIKNNNINVFNEMMKEKEIFYIELYQTYKNGYNLTIGGEGIVGFIMTQEQKNKISKIHKGKKLTEEHKQAISNFFSSDKNPNRGRKLTQEQKDKISKANKGRLLKDKNPMWGKSRPDLSKRNLQGSYKVYQIDIKSHNILKIWDSLRDISRITGWNRKCISDCCNKITKQSHGYIWRYVDAKTSKVGEEYVSA